jgi:hypothetical protein
MLPRAQLSICHTVLMLIHSFAFLLTFACFNKYTFIINNTRLTFDSRTLSLYLLPELVASLLTCSYLLYHLTPCCTIRMILRLLPPILLILRAYMVIAIPMTLDMQMMVLRSWAYHPPPFYFLQTTSLVMSSPLPHPSAYLYLLTLSLSPLQSLGQLYLDP